MAAVGVLPPMPPRHRRARVVYLTTTLVSIHLDSFLGLARSQLRRHSPSRSVGAGEIGDRNENATQEPVASPESDYPNDELTDFRLAEDTTTWSSLAIARDNVQQSNSTTQQSVNANNNLPEPRIRRNSSVESLADYEGGCIYCVCLSVCLSVYLSICLSVYLPVCCITNLYRFKE